jgi:3-oxoacyl-[acyl-carrier protein] reductase
MNLQLSGKTALITGSSRGIGLAIATALHAEGCKVVLNARDRDSLEAASAALPGSAISCGDVTRPEDAQKIVAEVVSTFGRLDILVCNVGSGRSVAPGCETVDEWQRVFALNLWSVTNAVEASREALATSRGNIVCISSICGVEIIPGAPTTYSCAKAALNTYVRSIARPLGKQHIRINAVAPGNILFDGSVWARKLVDDEDEVQHMLNRDVALGRLGKPEEVADLVLYLASPRAGFATGGIWTLDGGQVHA